MATNEIGHIRLFHLLNHLQIYNATNSKLSSLLSSSNTTRNLTFVLITGCSRGIGYGLTEYFLTNRANYYVIATCRTPDNANKLQLLISKYPGRSIVFKLNVNSEESIKKCCENVLKVTNKIDILINNAAIMRHFENVIGFDANKLNIALQTNIIGPALMFKIFNKLLTKNKNKLSKVLNITSRLGSLKYAKYNNKIHGIPAVSYRVSKSALNMLTRCQAFQIGEKNNIIVTAICPGHVDTDLGTMNQKVKASVSLKESSESIVTFIEQMNMKDHSGKFYAYQNKQKQYQITPW